MKSRPSAKLLMTGFILLLAIQLTGLSCLDEWYPSHASPTVATQSLTQTVGMSQTGDDGCPCHFVFQSVSAPAPDIIAPLVDDVWASATLFVPTFVVILFHPPLNL